jgi:hypothetical protein
MPKEMPYTKEWYAQNKNRIKQKLAEWCKGNDNKRRTYHQSYYQRNKAKMKAQAKAWRQANPYQYKSGVRKKASGLTSRKGAKDYHRIGLKNGFVWCGKVPKNVMTPTAWLCDNLHVTEKTYKQIYDGGKCALCLKKNQKKNISLEAVERYSVSYAD